MVHRALFIWVALVLTPSAAPADQLRQATFQEKVAQSDLVAIVRVTSVYRGGEHGVGSLAKATVVETLKGDRLPSIEVSTYIDISEMDPRCCDQGATYLMFLRRAPNGSYFTTWGHYGMIRVGGQASYEAASSLQACKPQPRPNSLFFRGPSNAIGRVQAFAKEQAVLVDTCTDGASQILVVPAEDNIHLPVANRFVRAFQEGRFPDVEMGLVGYN